MKNSQSSALQKVLFENRNTDALSFIGGQFSDTFVGPNKIIREGVFEIEGDSEFEGIEYRGVITLGRLVPKAKKKAAA